MTEFLTILRGYWSSGEVMINVIVFMNLLGALLLGLVVGYEHSYHGRAAGMRTYGLVCMASAALIVVTGYPAYWFGGGIAAHTAADPTRVIQGIVTGVGFLCAGVIMKEGLSISGLTTAASIWLVSAIGILIGVGFYAAAILLAALSAASMMWGWRLENWLPSRPAIAVVLKLESGTAADFAAVEHAVRGLAENFGYELATGTFALSREAGHTIWRFVVVAVSHTRSAPLAQLAAAFGAVDNVCDLSLVHARN